MDEYGQGGCGMTDRAPPLWIDESPITLCQRERFQRGRTSFFIVLVPMNGRTKSATSLRHGRIQQVLSVARPCHPVDTVMRQYGLAIDFVD